MIKAAYGESVPLKDLYVKELTEGFCNVAYDITIPGQEMILKIAPPGISGLMSYEKNMMKAEVEALRLVRAETVVPVPEVYFYDESHSICSSDYFVMEKLSGESFHKLRGTMLEKEQNFILKEIGSYNEEMNRITGDSFGYLGQQRKQGTSWKESFLAMISEVLSDGEKIQISLGIGYEEVRKLIEKASFSLEQVITPRFVHWDLWDGNVFIKNGKVVGIIDFERALWGDPLMEYFFRRHCYHPDFIKGYGRDLRREEPIRALLYDLYLYLIMVIETKYRSYPDDWQYQFATKQLKDSAEELWELINNKNNPIQ
jgi:aminoglycoside phosphotransferase (APT) family kinase protein